MLVLAQYRTAQHRLTKHLSLGRRPTVLLAHLVYLVGGVATLLVSSYPALVLARFLVGCAHHTVSHLPFLIVVEYCGSARH